MKTARLTIIAGCVMLSLAMGTAHAVEDTKWRADLHSCQIVKTFAFKSKTAAGSTLYGDTETVNAGANNVLNDNSATVFLSLEDALAIQKELPALKKCDAFYKCVAKRDWHRYTPDAEPKWPIPKHCYEKR
jgi:hypothetical protein